MTRRRLTLTFPILAIFFAGCASTTLQTAPPTITYPVTATFLPTQTPSPTPTAVPTLTNTAMPIATQFCMGSSASWSCTCGDLSMDTIQIKTSNTAGHCEVSMPEAYRITLPDHWYCNVAGVFASNLSCITADVQRIFVQSLVSDLPVQDADQTIVIFQEGGGSYTYPIVEENETKISREVKTVGERQVLRLLTLQEDTTLLRYFIKNNDDLYVFTVKPKGLAETRDLSALLEVTIDSIQFIQ